MKKILLLPILLFALASCAQKSEKTDDTSFTKEALNDKMKSLTDGKEIAFKDVLDKYKGKVVVIDIWASWCPDCIKGMDKVHALQNKYKSKDVVFLFLSYDKTEEAWRKGIEKYHVNGEHYLISSKWKGGAFSEAVRLDWIPRYMVVDKFGKIAHFKAIEADDAKMAATLNGLVNKK